MKEEDRRFIWFHRNASLHTNKLFLNGNAITDELPNIHFSLTTVRDTSLPGIQIYFIYSSRVIGKPPWISIEKFGLSSKFSLYSFGLTVSRDGFPGKTKAFKANLGSIFVKT